MIKNKIVIAAFIFFVGSVFVARVKADDVLSQPVFSDSRSEYWGSYTAAIGIASGTISEFGTTTVALGNAMIEDLGWECNIHLENNAVPFWCDHYIPLTVATTTTLGTSTQAIVLQNPHQAVDGNVQLFYVDFYGGDPAFMGFGTPENMIPNLSWGWTCGPYCRNGGTLGGTSNDFVPYFEMGPQADPPGISSLNQSGQSGGSIQEGGTVFGRSLLFGASLRSNVGDPLVLEVEVEPMGMQFTGIPTASSTSIGSSGTASVIVPDLPDGGYRWAARAVDASTSESSPWTLFDPGSIIADFMVQAPKEPVVFIPGIVGSRLTRASDGKELWPDIGDMLMSPSDSYLDDLALAPDGSQIPGKEMAASSIIDQESVLGIPVSFYKKTLQALEADGYSSGTSLFAVPYDWRLSIMSAAAVLANTVAAARAASPNGKISIVGYSLGGLIAKEYLAGLSDTSFLDTLILAGAPQLGSPEAFKVLNYGDNLDFQIPVLNIDILNHSEVKKIAQNMPSIYELLPSRAYIADAGGYVQDFRNDGSSVLDYDATSHLMLEDPADSRNGQLLASADTLHGGLDGAPANAPDVYNIVGCGEPTISEYHLYDNGVVDVSRDAGDGTVPLVSAMDRADGFKNYFVSGNKTGITHTSLVSDPRTLALITAILNGDPSLFILPDGFSTSSNSCFSSASSGPGGESSIEFSAHGAAGLTVQDGAGQSTGIDASGTVELGIPDSTYETIGDNYFITVPAGDAYHMIAESSSSDDLILKTKGYDGSSITQTATYVVSSTPSEGNGAGTATTTAELDFTNFDSPANLTVTENGDTSSSLSVAPIVEASSSDITPPVITVTGIPTTAVTGSTTTVSFSASDTDSGVASLHATLNGIPVSNGDTVTFTQNGENIFRVEAMDNAGNPSVKEIDFIVFTPEIKELFFSPIADTYIDGDAPDANHGGDAILRLRARGKNRALVKFDSAAINAAVGSSTIVSAALTFTIAKNWENWAATGSLALYRMAASWAETGATWNTEDFATGTALWAVTPSAATTVSNDTTSTVSFNVAVDISAFLSGAEDDGWILQKVDECEPGVIDLGSRESAAPPILTVTYVSSK